MSNYDDEILEDLDGFEEEILDSLNDLVDSGDVIIDHNMDNDNDNMDDENIDDQDLDDNENEDIPNDAIITLEHHTDAVYSVILKEIDNCFIIGTGGGDEIGTIISIKKDSNDENYNISSPIELKGHSDSITNISWNYDNTILATGGMDGIIQLWKENGELITQLQGPSDSIDWIDWHPRGNVIVCGSSDSTGWMWNTKGSCLSVFSGHDGPLTCGKFTPNGKLLITGSSDESIKIWSPTKGIAQQTISGDLFHQAPILCFDCTDTLIMSGAENGTLRLSNIISGKILQKFENHDDSVECVNFSPILPIISSCSLDGTIKIWDLNSGQLRSTVLAHEGGVIKSIMHSSEPLLYSCGADNTIKIWDIRSSTLIKTFQGHTKTVLDFDISSDGKTIVTSSDDETVRLFKW